MAKGGRVSLRPSYGRPKLTLISREKKYLRKAFQNYLAEFSANW